jgi:hypothetical protein
MALDEDVRTDYETVRAALSADDTEYSGADLDYPITFAHEIVEQQVAPYAGANSESALTRVETELAAALAIGGRDQDRPVESIEQQSASVDFADIVDVAGPAGSHWERAQLADPTGRLGTDPDDFWSASV